MGVFSMITLGGGGGLTVCILLYLFLTMGPELVIILPVLAELVRKPVIEESTSY